MNKVKLFAKTFLAVVKGDTDEARMLKNLRKADAALETQIAIKKGTRVELETAIEEAKEALEKALVNDGNDITNGEAYVKLQIDRQNAVLRAEEALEVHNKNVTFLEDRRKALSTEVEA